MTFTSGDTWSPEEGWGAVKEQIDSGYFIKRASEEAMWAGAPNEEVKILADGSHTRGLASFLEYRIGPGCAGPPAHWHVGHDELFYIVSGELKGRVAAEEKVLQPRDFLFVPRGVVHTFTNPFDEECIFVSGWNPAGAEQLFNFIQTMTPEELAQPDVLLRVLEMGRTLPEEVQRVE